MSLYKFARNKYWRQKLNYFFFCFMASRIIICARIALLIGAGSELVTLTRHLKNGFLLKCLSFFRCMSSIFWQDREENKRMDSPTSASKLTLYDSNLGKLGHHVAPLAVLQYLHDLSRWVLCVVEVLLRPNDAVRKSPVLRCLLFVALGCASKQCYGSSFRINFFRFRGWPFKSFRIRPGFRC